MRYHFPWWVCIACGLNMGWRTVKMLYAAANIRPGDKIQVTVTYTISGGKGKWLSLKVVSEKEALADRLKLRGF